MEDPNKCGWQKHTHAAWERRRGSSAEEREGSEREASWEGGREEQNKAKRNFFECKKEGCGPLDFDGRHVSSSTRRRTKIEPRT